MLRPNLIITAAYLAVAGMLIASCIHFGIGNTAIGVLVASAAVA